MISFYERLLTGVRKGDLGFFEDYIYKHDPAYTEVADDMHRELTERIQAIWT